MKRSIDAAGTSPRSTNCATHAAQALVDHEFGEDHQRHTDEKARVGFDVGEERDVDAAQQCSLDGAEHEQGQPDDRAGQHDAAPDQATRVIVHPAISCARSSCHSGPPRTSEKFCSSGNATATGSSRRGERSGVAALSPVQTVMWRISRSDCPRRVRARASRHRIIHPYRSARRVPAAWRSRRRYRPWPRGRNARRWPAPTAHDRAQYRLLWNQRSAHVNTRKAGLLSPASRVVFSRCCSPSTSIACTLEGIKASRAGLALLLERSWPLVAAAISCSTCSSPRCHFPARR